MIARRPVRSVFVLCFLALHLAIACSIPHVAAASNEKLVQEIEQAWQRRESKYHSVVLVYDRHVSEPTPTVGKPSSEVGLQDRTQYDQEITFKNDRQRMSLQRTGQMWSKEQGLYRSNYRTATNRKVSASLYTSSSWEFNSAFIYQDTDPQITYELVTRALRFLCYTHEPGILGFDIGKATVAKENVLVDGRECVQLTIYGGIEGSTESIWVCPELDYSVLQYETHKGGKVRVLMVCEYQQTDSGHWLPATVSYTRFVGKGKPGRQVLDTLKKWDTSPEFRARDFELAFPDGTVVRDYRDNAESKRFLVRNHGQRRLILESESQADYQMLLATDPGEAVDR